MSVDHDDLTRLRSRASDEDDEASRQGEPDTVGAVRLAAITVVVSSYPATAACFYGFRFRDIDGPEIEGGAGTETTSGGIGYAYNLGGSVPPVGTVIEVTKVPVGRWVFTFGTPRTT